MYAIRSYYADTGYSDKPLYSFGYGLSYNNYSYGEIEITDTNGNVCNKFSENDIIIISTTITNHGKYHSSEIVQLYVNDIISSVTTPIKELKGFNKVILAPDETKRVEIELKVSDLELINAQCQCVVEKGEFEIMLGSSSDDKNLRKKLIRIV